MKLRGKDYCNCDHAHMLRDALQLALGELKRSNPIEAAATIRLALEADNRAQIDLWGDLDTELERR